MRALIALSALLLAACTTPKVITEPSRFASIGSEYGKDAAVYVFRDSSAAKVWPMNVVIDGIERGSLRDNTFTKFPLPAGAHQLEISWNFIAGVPKATVIYTFEEGKTYYFVGSASSQFNGGFLQTTTNLKEIDFRMAEGRLSFYKERPSKQ